MNGFREIGEDEVVRPGHRLRFGSGATLIDDASQWMGKTLADVRKEEAEHARVMGYETVELVILEKTE